jgi:hypothetical protein
MRDSVCAVSGKEAKVLRPALSLKGVSAAWKRNKQVALSVRDESTLERKLRPLDAIRDHHPKFLLTLDDDPPADCNGIRRLNALDWLLADGALL